MNKSKWFLSFTATLIVAIFITIITLIILFSESNTAIFFAIIFILVFDSLFGLIILNSKRPAEIKVSWLFIILLIPLFGPLFFVMFGVNNIGKKKWKDYNSQQADLLKLEDYVYSEKFSSVQENINSSFITALSSTFRPVYENNKIEIIEFNEDLFEKSLFLIRSAKFFIHIEMYLVRDGIWAKAFADELIKKAESGVKIRVLYDWVGCVFKVKNKYWRNLKKHGIEVAVFNPRGLNIFKGTTNFRSHKKIIVVDNKQALVGGSNIGDEYLGISKKTFHWRDMNFLVEGEIVNTLNVIFSSDWLFFTKKSISSQSKESYLKNLPMFFQKHYISEKTIAQAMESSPGFEEKVIKSNLCNLIYRAQKSIYIVSPYLCPTPDIIDALKIAARDGIEVKIIVPGKPDDKSYILDLNRNSYQNFLQVGCKIYEYNGFIHSKYMIIDDEKIFMGSYNLDYRSLWINFENAILIDSRDLSRKLKEIYHKDQLASKEVTQNYNNEYRSFKTKLMGLFLSIFYPLL